MELASITMDRHAARRAFLEYRDAIRRRASEEDAAIMRGYRELAAGRQIVNLTNVLGGAGLDEKGLPKLAIARADLMHIRLKLWMDGSACFYVPDGRNGRYECESKTVRLPAGTFSDVPKVRSDVRAIVPIVPPGLRPAAALSNYHILWEADWKRVPKDPALLKDLGGGLYTVLAVWDLTELERAVLGMTRRVLPR